MRYLVVDSSAGSFVAVVSQKNDMLQVEKEIYNPNTREHTESIAPFVKAVLGDNREIDAVIVGSGPAPFTGLRAGIMTAQVVSYVQNIPIYGVGTLDHLAMQIYQSSLVDVAQTVAVMTDARRREVYFAAYQAAGDDVKVLLTPQVAKAELALQQIAEIEESVVISGMGAELYLAEQEIPANLSYLSSVDGQKLERPHALAMVKMALSRLEQQKNGKVVDLSVTPKYLRRPDVYAGVPRKVS